MISEGVFANSNINLHCALVGLSRTQNKRSVFDYIQNIDTLEGTDQTLAFSEFWQSLSLADRLRIYRALLSSAASP